jgi:hypothetical protein
MSPSGARHCPKCGGEVRDNWRVCPACAQPLDGETKTMFGEGSSTSAEEGRFPAGTVLAGRYRVLGLIGHGGMGEVYRAYDLILNQAVALKFLGRANMSEAALARFHDEVRVARPGVAPERPPGLRHRLHRRFSFPLNGVFGRRGSRISASPHRKAASG